MLTRNPDAIQIGLTATPRKLKFTETTEEARIDCQITADNIRYFGEPVYEYDMAQAIEDGYLAACELYRFDLFHDDKAVSERESGVSRAELAGKTLVDAITGQPLSIHEAREHYGAAELEDKLVMPDRVKAMTKHLFQHLLHTAGPEQKTIIFCARDTHAEAVAIAMNNLYAGWCSENGRTRAEPYAFQCTASVGGADYIADLRAASRHHFIATTVDLLTTGVDVPPVRNIAFFKYVQSPIAFHQMVGRGSRIDIPTAKLMFRVYDYTNATRLLAEDFVARAVTPGAGPPREGPPPERTVQVQGVQVAITQAGHDILTEVAGQPTFLPLEEYKQRLAAKLIEEAPTLDHFRARWIAPPERRALLSSLPDAGRSAFIVQELDDMKAYDLYDVLGELGYGLSPRTRIERADAFTYKHDVWLRRMPAETSATVRALAAQFGRGGTEELENPQIFRTPEVVRAGGMKALRMLGDPAEILRETKERMFAA